MKLKKEKEEMEERNRIKNIEYNKRTNGNQTIADGNPTNTNLVTMNQKTLILIITAKDNKNLQVGLNGNILRKVLGVGLIRSRKRIVKTTSGQS